MPLSKIEHKRPCLLEQFKKTSLIKYIAVRLHEPRFEAQQGLGVLQGLWRQCGQPFGLSPHLRLQRVGVDDAIDQTEPRRGRRIERFPAEQHGARLLGPDGHRKQVGGRALRNKGETHKRQFEARIRDSPRQVTVQQLSRVLGATPSPFDTWLANIGLKTFELRMERHASNGMTIARWLAAHPKVTRVFYPGLETHPGFDIANRQMVNGYGGMISFELTGGLAAGAALMNQVQLPTLAVSLGNVDSLIEHPASMTHKPVPKEERLRANISDGLVRLSVGIEDVNDLIADLEQALDRV